MKNVNVKEMMKQKRVLGSLAALAAAVVIGGTAFFQSATEVPEFPDIKDPIMVATIEEEETPLAAAPKVTTKTTSKTTKKNVKISKAATKTYTKKLATTTKTSTAKSSTAKEDITTQTTVKTEKTEKYTKKSKTKAVTTKVTTTVKTTTVAKAQPTPTAQPVKTGLVEIDSVAPLMDSRVRSAYKTLNFTITLDANVSYSGYFNAKGQSITLNAKQMAMFSDTVYHELGHFVAFAAGNVDTKPEFAAIYSAEKSKLAGVTNAYASQSASEFFAECVRVYTLNPSSLKSTCPKTYDTIEKALATITDSRVAMMKKVYGAYWKF